MRITVPNWLINDEIFIKLLTVLSPYPDLIIDWCDDMSKLDTVIQVFRILEEILKAFFTDK
ncbi:hypothetical protein BKG95_10710 [Rodentibacter pneumotropicus]|uniref:Uncharacterized protein n=1 Tax=Rodentibacter pneumotropicus TaxID=758 RepID=A0AAW5LBF2_9PAST|nr:hypothetical protein [Rodentibacter pneumotropicus]MCQ9121353.1 hypothetical protein [Rodentibacter pneumotropicus]OOF66392.1 hypothetical protein BKG95_10710 [Rodentibacter pneumotropicus]